jgi:hypothetical protein
MSIVRRSLFSALIMVGFIGAIPVALPHQASATTGPTQFLPSPKFKVNSKTELLYIGQYELHSSAKGALLKGGAMGIEINNDDGALYGVAQFYAYTQKGEQSTWIGTLYNFQLVKNNIMRLEILAPSGHPVLADMALARSAKGDLTGTIKLATGTFAITWHKLTSR